MLKIYLKIGLMLIICWKILSMSYLLWPCLTHWFYLISNSINSMIWFGSPLGPTLANVFLYYHKKLGFKPVVLNLPLLSIEGTLMILFHLKHLIEKFCNYLNLQHNNIRFTSEIENENSISFLDIKMSRGNSRVFTNFGSFIPKLYK